MALPAGFVIDKPEKVKLPSGFVLDSDKAGLPSIVKSEPREAPTYDPLGQVIGDVPAPLDYTVEGQGRMNEPGAFTTVADLAKQFIAPGAKAPFALPLATETAAKGVVRQALEQPESSMTSAVQPGIVRLLSPLLLQQRDKMFGPKTEEERLKKQLEVQRTIASIPSIPGAKALNKIGEDVQKDILGSLSPEAKKALAESQITGNIFKGEVDFGTNPNAYGYALQAANVFGSMAPVIATAMVTKSPGAGGFVGGTMAADEAATKAAEFINKIPDAELRQKSPLYAELIAGGASPKEARELTIKKAAESGAALQALVATFGDVVTGKLVTGAFDKTIAKLGTNRLGRAAGVGTASSLEEAFQETGEGLASDVTLKNVIPSKELGEDSAANFILGALGGAGPGIAKGALSEGEPKAPQREKYVQPEGGLAELIARQKGFLTPEGRPPAPPAAPAAQGPTPPAPPAGPAEAIQAPGSEAMDTQAMLEELINSVNYPQEKAPEVAAEKPVEAPPVKAPAAVEAPKEEAPKAEPTLKEQYDKAAKLNLMAPDAFRDRRINQEQYDQIQADYERIKTEYQASIPKATLTPIQQEATDIADRLEELGQKPFVTGMRSAIARNQVNKDNLEFYRSRLKQEQAKQNALDEGIERPSEKFEWTNFFRDDPKDLNKLKLFNSKAPPAVKQALQTVTDTLQALTDRLNDEGYTMYGTPNSTVPQDIKNLRSQIQMRSAGGVKLINAFEALNKGFNRSKKTTNQENLDAAIQDIKVDAAEAQKVLQRSIPEPEEVVEARGALAQAGKQIDALTYKSGSLWSALAGKLDPEEVREIFGRNPSLGNKKLQVTKKSGKRGTYVTELAADGLLDPFLPPAMRHESSRFDAAESAQYIKDLVNNKEYLPYDVKEEIKNIQEGVEPFGDLIDEYLTIEEQNRELQIAFDEQRKIDQAAEIVEPEGEDRAAKPSERPAGEFELTAPTKDELKAKQDEIDRLSKENERLAKQAEDKAKADEQVSEFTLTGSDRAADVAAARGQKDIFAEEPTESKSLKAMRGEKFVPDALDKKAIAIYKQIKENNPDADVDEEIENPNHLHEVEEQPNSKGIKIGDLVYRKGNPVPEIAITVGEDSVKLIDQKTGNGLFTKIEGVSKEPIPHDYNFDFGYGKIDVDVETFTSPTEWSVDMRGPGASKTGYRSALGVVFKGKRGTPEFDKFVEQVVRNNTKEMAEAAPADNKKEIADLKKEQKTLMLQIIKAGLEETPEQEARMAEIDKRLRELEGKPAIQQVEKPVAKQRSVEEIQDELQDLEDQLDLELNKEKRKSLVSEISKLQGELTAAEGRAARAAAEEAPAAPTEAEIEAAEEAAEEEIRNKAEAEIDEGPIGQAIAKIENGDIETKAQIRTFIKKLERDGTLDDVEDVREGLSDREQDASEVLDTLSGLLDEARDNAIDERVDELLEERETEQPEAPKGTVATPDGAVLRYPLAVSMVGEGYKVLALDDPRTYKDKGGEPHRTFEKGPLRIAMTPQRVLFQNRNAVNVAFGNPDQVTLEAIMVDPGKRNQGLATQAMNDVIEAADKNEITLYLEPVPIVNIKKNDFGLDRDQLVDFYSKFGFEFQEDSNKVMQRKPSAEAEVLPAEEPQIAGQVGFEPYTIEGDFTEVAEEQQRLMLEDQTENLSDDQVSTLEKHYGATIDSDEFFTKLREDVTNFIVKGATAVNGKIRAIIRQLANGVLAVGIAFNPQYMSQPINVFMPVDNVRTEEVLAKVPDAATDKMSEPAKRAFAVIYPALQEQMVAKDKLFIMADKPSGRMFVFNPDGSLLLEKKSLFGLAKGDLYVGDNDKPQNRITPAGLFDLKFVDAAKGAAEKRTAGDYDTGTVLAINDPDGTITIMHSVWLKEKDAAQRAAALRNESPADSRYSFGCINVDAPTYKYMVDNHAKQMDGAALFIVPEAGVDVMSFITGKGAMSEDLARIKIKPVTKEVRTPQRQATQAEAKTKTPGREQQFFSLEKQTSTPAFKKFFGDSKVVDENGNPMIVYHATSDDFDSFDPSKDRRENGLIFFAEDPANAEATRFFDKREASHIMPVYLRIEKMFDGLKGVPKELQDWILSNKDSLEKELNEYEQDWGLAMSALDYLDKDDTGEFNPKNYIKAIAKGEWQAIEASKSLIKKIKELGYDGIKMYEDGNTYAVFNGNQIKSATGNRGTFDESGNINMSVEGKKLPPGRSPELAAAARLVKEGKMTAAEFDKMVNQYKPIRPYEAPLKPATRAEMVDALSSEKKDKVSPDIPEGTRVGLRLDIPAFNRKGVYVVTIHEKGNASGPGKAIGYDSVAVINNVNFGTGSQKKALNIATGEAKDALQTMEGEFVKSDPAAVYAAALKAMDDPSWTQIGVDPTRHAYFFDRNTTQPVVAAEQVIQIGNTVLAKNVTYGKKESFLYNLEDDMVRLVNQIADSIADNEKKRSPSFKRTAKTLTRQRGEGKITDEEYLDRMNAAIEEDEESRLDKGVPQRVRGADFIREKLLNAKRRKMITAEGVDLAEWFIQQNPALVDDLGISVKGKGLAGVGGFYNSDARIINLIKDAGSSQTATHEILHHLERMMPTDIQNAIRKAWLTQLLKANKAAKDPAQRLYFMALLDAHIGNNNHDRLEIPKDLEKIYKSAVKQMQFASVLAGDPFGSSKSSDLAKNLLLYSPTVTNDLYEYFDPSEFWAVNGSDIVQARYEAVKGGVLAKLKNWLREFTQKIKSLLGLKSDASIIRALDSLAKSDGKFVTRKMLGTGEYRSIERRNYEGGEAPEPDMEIPEMSFMDDVIYKYGDKLIDTKRLIQSIQSTGRKIDERFDAYMKEENYHGRLAKRTKNFLDDEMRPVLVEMQDKNITLDELETFLLNRHAKEANAYIAKINPVGFPEAGSSVSNEAADKYMAELTPEKRKDLMDLAAKVDKIVKETQRVLVANGLETQDTIDEWNKTYKHYVPLQRDNLDFVHTGRGVMGGFGTRGSASKRRVGSDKPVIDIFANIAMQRERALRRSEQARVGRALYGMAIKHPNPGFWLAINPDAIKDKDKLEAELISLGLTPDDARSIIQEPRQPMFDKKTKTVKYQVNPLLRDSPNVFPIRINGEDRFIFFNPNDPRALRMVQSIRNLDTERLGDAIGMASMVTRWFASVNTQYNIVFGGVNFLRDLSAASLNLSTTEIAGKEKEVRAYVLPALRAIYRDLRGKGATDKSIIGISNETRKKEMAEMQEWFERFQLAGGQTGYQNQFAETKRKGNVVEQELKRLNRGNTKKFVDSVFNWLSDYNDAIENAVRLAAFRVAVEKGKLSDDKAASIAKNLTVNFNRKGARTGFISALYAFFNAAVQGSTRMVETLRGPMGKKIIFGGMLLGSMQAIVLAMAGFDDDEPPEFVKDKNLIIPIPFTDKKYLSVPMPLGFNMFPGFGRLAMETLLIETGMIRSRKGPGDKVMSAVSLVFDAFNPLGGSGNPLLMAVPTIGDPFAAIYSNKDSFGRPIYKEDRGTAPTPGYERSRENASILSKKLAEAINYVTSPAGTQHTKGFFSPTADEIDYFIGQITGGVGREIMKVGEFAKSKGVTQEEVPAYRLPVVGRFYGEAESPAATRSRFYENVTVMAKHEHEIKGLRKDRVSPTEYVKANPEARLWQRANNVENQIVKLNKEKRALIEKDAPREAVKRKEDEILKKMTEFNNQVRRGQ